jgi:hypothetical protein
MMLALQAAGMEVNNIKDSHTHWFLGRRFATKGYSYDAKGQVTLQLNYTSLDSALLLHNYMVHKRQIQVKPDGIAVVY